MKQYFLSLINKPYPLPESRRNQLLMELALSGGGVPVSFPAEAVQSQANFIASACDVWLAVIILSEHN